MATERGSRATHEDVGPADVLMVTVDVLPQPYEVLGMVEATMAVQHGIVSTTQLMNRLAAEAVTIGADGVIGIRVSHINQAVISRPGLLGGSHHQSTNVAIALGTAVRLLPDDR